MKRNTILYVSLAAACAALMTACSGGGASSGANAKASEAKAAEAVSVISDPDESFTLSADEAPVENMAAAEGEYSSFIRLGDYSGLEVSAGKDATIESGMTVNIDYSAYIDGESFDGSRGEDYELIIGAGMFLDDVEDALLGKKCGQRVKTKAKYPKDYADSSLAGKEAVFDININDVYLLSPSIALSIISDESEVISYPKEMYDAWLTTVRSSMGYGDEADTSGESALPEEAAMDDELIEEMAKSNVKTELVCRAIMDAEGITPDSDIYKQTELSVLANYGFASAEEMFRSGSSEKDLEYAVLQKVCCKILADK